MRRSAAALCAVAASAALVLAGCATVAPASEAEQTTGYTGEYVATQPGGAETPSATPTVSAEPAVFSAAWTTDEGYVWELAITAVDVNVEKDVLNAPGEAVITVSINSRGTITNRTPGRIAEAAPGGLYPIWEAASLACQAPQSFVPRAIAGSDAWCMLQTGGDQGIGPSYAFLAAETRDLAEGQSSAVVSNENTLELVVAEDVADSVVAALQAPAGYILGSNNATQLGNCRVADSMAEIVASSIPLGC